MLASVAADRTLIAEHAPHPDWRAEPSCSMCVTHDARVYRAVWRGSPWPCRTLRLRISAYRDKSGWLRSGHHERRLLTTRLWRCRPPEDLLLGAGRRPSGTDPRMPNPVVIR